MDRTNLGKVCATGIGFALAFLAAKLYEMNKSSTQIQASQSSSTSSNQKQQQKQNSRELQKLAELQELLAYKSHSFQVERLTENKDILTRKCIIALMQETVDLIDTEETVALFTENRIARRCIFSEISNIKDPSKSIGNTHQCETYFRFVCTLDQNIKYILQKSQKDFAAFIGLDYGDIIRSVAYHTDSDQSENSVQFGIKVMEVMSRLRDSLHQHLPLYSSPASLGDILEVLHDQIDLVTNQKQRIINLVKKLGIERRQEEEALPILLTSYIDDYIFEKYRLESEQLSVSQEQMDEQMTSMMEQFKHARDVLIEEMHAEVQDSILLHSDSQEDYDDDY